MGLCTYGLKLSQSFVQRMPSIGLIVTGEEALREFCIFVQTLEVWHPDAQLYIYTDSCTDISSVSWKGKIHIRKALNQYRGLGRNDMEKMPGNVYNSLWKDYMYEKTNVLEWMFETNSEAWFMDVDISFLAPLPTIPSSATLALSPHYIRESYTRKFGFYNAGFLWMRDRNYLTAWREAGHTTRFYEQSALETVAEIAKQSGEFYEFPIQVNFGWWRMIQSDLSPSTVQSKFTIFRNEQSIGVRYDGLPLQSIHTHWSHQFHYHDPSFFNNWFLEFTKKFSKHPPLSRFRKTIQA